jgi:flagellar biogenesis protein FliO
MRTVRSLAASVDRVPVWARFPTKTLVLSLVLVATAAVVFAVVDRVAPPPAPVKPRKEPARVEAPSIGSGPFVAVAAVIAGAVAAMFGLKRVLKGSRHVPAGRKILQVRDVLAMGPKRAIYLIGLEHRSLVIGVSGDQLTLLSEYSAGDEEEPAAEPAPHAAPQRTAAPAPRAAPAPPPAPAVADEPPAHLDVEVGDEGPSFASPAAEQGASRTFPFAAVGAAKAQAARSRSERVPQRFRELLERAAQADGAAR